MARPHTGSESGEFRRGPLWGAGHVWSEATNFHGGLKFRAGKNFENRRSKSGRVRYRSFANPPTGRNDWRGRKFRGPNFRGWSDNVSPGHPSWSRRDSSRYCPFFLSISRRALAPVVHAAASRLRLVHLANRTPISYIITVLGDVGNATGEFAKNAKSYPTVPRPDYRYRRNRPIAHRYIRWRSYLPSLPASRNGASLSLRGS